MISASGIHMPYMENAKEPLSRVLPVRCQAWRNVYPTLRRFHQKMHA